AGSVPRCGPRPRPPIANLRLRSGLHVRRERPRHGGDAAGLGGSARAADARAHADPRDPLALTYVRSLSPRSRGTTRRSRGRVALAQLPQLAEVGLDVTDQQLLQRVAQVDLTLMAGAVIRQLAVKVLLCKLRQQPEQCGQSGVDPSDELFFAQV